MILLAIDTATECCSAALWANGKIFHKSSVQPRLHAEIILPFIDELLCEANVLKSDIEGLIVGQGPGAFTGVRIGVGVAQGLALALNIPVLPVSNLETLAFAAYKKLDTSKEQKILVATDARMNETYSAKYLIKDHHIKQLSKEVVTNASDINLSQVDAYIGSAFSVYPELQAFAESMPMPYDTNQYSQAQDMLDMVKNGFIKFSTHIENIEPIYLREP
ncbi:MAG: tRNA (adenosine(37)-N6)-threonylcarbamoyltransferase complex dimerization subunit type 1 TsaB [Marinicellaceae bacterium]